MNPTDFQMALQDFPVDMAGVTGHFYQLKGSIQLPMIFFWGGDRFILNYNPSDFRSSKGSECCEVNWVVRK